MSLFDGLAHWYGLGDCCGALLDSPAASPRRDGSWVNSAGIARGPGAAVGIPCMIDEGGYAQGGWARSGVAGGEVPYPGGASFYDPASFTLALFWRTGVHHPLCPGLITDFTLPPYGIGNYFPGDTASSAGHPYMSTATFVSDGSLPPASDPARWRHMDDWYGCYGDKAVYYSFGLVGDHSGFPFNAGWGIYTKPVFAPIGALNPDGIEVGFALRFVCESGVTADIDISAGDLGPWPPEWMYTVITSDGIQLKVYEGLADGSGFGLVGVADATQFVTSSASLGFGYYDNNKALSGKHELWQGNLDEGIIWDRPLTYDEIGQLPGLWCRRRYALHSAHRAVPNANARASRFDAALHLSGMKHRADPQAVPSSGSGAPLVDLSGGSFRARL